MELKRCSHCGRELPEGTTKRRLFCSDPCKKRGWRRQQAGVREDAYRDGGLRGRVPLGTLTNRERAVSLILTRRR